MLNSVRLQMRDATVQDRYPQFAEPVLDFAQTNVETESAPDYRTLSDVMDTRCGRVIFGVGEYEPSYWLLKLAGMLDAERHPSLSVTVMASADHNLRSYVDQRAVHRLVDELLIDTGAMSPTTALVEAEASGPG